MIKSAGPLVQFEWSKAIETGHEAVDSEHMKLVGLLEQLRGVLSDESEERLARANAALDELREYTKYHFANEECLMETFEYDDRELHLRAHAAFIRKVTDARFDEASVTEASLALLRFLYDWLIAHISNVDQVMVAKLMGRTGREEGNQVDQTAAVIDCAYQVAASLAEMTDALRTVQGPVQRAALRKKVTDASERLLNLVTLADVRVKSWGCPLAQRSRLAGIRSAVVSSACSLIEGNAHHTIQYGGKILSGETGLPFGCGSVLKMRIEAISTLISLIGGASVLSVAQRAQVIEAYRVANEVRALEWRQYRLPEFAMGDSGAPVPFELPDDIAEGAASQADVLVAAAAGRS
jgi:hemerythrin-like metal-binding protein